MTEDSFLIWLDMLWGITFTLHTIMLIPHQDIHLLLPIQPILHLDTLTLDIPRLQPRILLQLDTLTRDILRQHILRLADIPQEVIFQQAIQLLQLLHIIMVGMELVWDQ